MPDEDVVARIAAGEVALFELIMRRYNQRLYRIARSIVRDDDEAQDTVQQAYLSAYAHLRQFAGESQFSTWLTRIAINEALGRLKQRARGAKLHASEEDGIMQTSEPQSSSNPEEEASRREMSRMLEQVIDELPAIYRMVFVMRELEQMSTLDTATALDATEEAVKVRLHRAKGMLREAMSARMQASLADAYPFLGARCDRIVQAVMDAVAPAPRR
jgi:RNA polymerase sigma-70 factor (ECF subfamily)